MYTNTYFALVSEFMDLRMNGFTYEMAVARLKRVILYAEELDIGVFTEFQRLCKGIDQYSTIKP